MLEEFQCKNSLFQPTICLTVFLCEFVNCVIGCISYEREGEGKTRQSTSGGGKNICYEYCCDCVDVVAYVHILLADGETL